METVVEPKIVQYPTPELDYDMKVTHANDKLAARMTGENPSIPAYQHHWD